MGTLLERVPESALFAVVGAAAVSVLRILGGWIHHRVSNARSARRARQLSGEFDTRHFSIGRFRTSMFVADLHTPGYRPNLLRCEVVGRLELDEVVLRAGYEQRRKESERGVEQGQIYNGSVLALREYKVDRTPGTEQPLLRLRFAETDYITQRAITECFRSLPEQNRDSLASATALGGPDAGPFSATFGTSVAVVTADDQLMWLRRSMNSAVNAGRFSCTTAEGMNRDDVRSGQPDPYLCAARGLYEEIGVRLAADEVRHIRLTALALNMDWWEWGLLGTINLGALTGRRLDASTLAEYFTSSQAKDKWETAEPTFVRFRPRDVARFVTGQDVTNYGAVSAVFALLADRRFHRDEVAKAFEARRTRASTRNRVASA